MASHRFVKLALFVLVLLMPIFIGAARVARADRWAAPTPGIYASSGKPSSTRYGFHLVNVFVKDAQTQNHNGYATGFRYENLDPVTGAITHVYQDRYDIKK